MQISNTVSRPVTFYIIPESALTSMIEMCQAIGTNPQHFAGAEAACDSEILANLTERAWIEEAVVALVQENYEFALVELRSKLKLRFAKDLLSLSLPLQPLTEGASPQGVVAARKKSWGISTEYLAKEFHSKLSLILKDLSRKLELSGEFLAPVTVIAVDPQSEPMHWLAELMPKSGFEFDQDENRLGLNDISDRIGFLTSANIAAYNFGIPEFRKRLNLWQGDKKFEWQNLGAALAGVFEMSLTPARDDRLALVFRRCF
jgi:hypothetical protein